MNDISNDICLLIACILGLVVCFIALWLLKQNQGLEAYNEILAGLLDKRTKELNEARGKRMHKIKLKDEFCDAVLYGRKTFEVRKNDRGYKVGDLIRFDAVTGEEGTMRINHNVCNHTYEITYILEGWGLQDGYVAFAIREKEEEA